MDDRYRKRKHKFMSFGFPSILLVFAMLCNIIFSALSFLTVHSDYKLTLKAAQNSAHYYKGEKKAYEELARIDQALLEAYQTAESEDIYFFSLSEVLAAYDGVYERKVNENYFTFAAAISDTQKLEVTLWLQYPQELNEGFYHIKSWRVTNSNEMEEGSHYQLADPSNNDERKDE